MLLRLSGRNATFKTNRGVSGVFASESSRNKILGLLTIVMFAAIRYQTCKKRIDGLPKWWWLPRYHTPYIVRSLLQRSNGSVPPDIPFRWGFKCPASPRRETSLLNLLGNFSFLAFFLFYWIWTWSQVPTGCPFIQIFGYFHPQPGYSEI